MSTEKVFSSGLATTEREYCQTASELINSKNFFIYLERFCQISIKENSEYEAFFNKYFNDEGYVDIWRIPLLLMDLIKDKYDYYGAMLNISEFRMTMMNFIGDFYNYVMNRSSLLAIDQQHFTDYKSNMFHIRKNQFLYNLITETYCKIYEKLNSLGDMKRGA